MTRAAFHTITLGCKLNQFDSAAIEGELSRRGFARAASADDASVVVINTCTVTAKADAEARRLIRSVRRRNADCRLLVTGCYAELDPLAVGSIPGVDRVFGNREKSALAGVLDELGIGTPARVRTAGRLAAEVVTLTRSGDRGCEAGLDVPEAVRFGERSRAFLKVQEGCDLACSYCVIPRVRGRSRSVPPDRVEEAFDGLLRSGYREVVLTGVNTGDYGRDLTPRTDLATLLARLLRRCGPNRIRLNSLEPLTVTEPIVELMASDPRLAPHLQVPLQSGSDDVLRRMRRNYRVATYLERLWRLRERVPDVGLGADVIVGFPGENDERFEETFRRIESSPLSYLHVFPWSPRPGTPASELDGRPSAADVRERSRRLRDLAAGLGYRFRSRFRERVLDAVVLGASADRRSVRALTGNFIEVALPPDAARRGDLIGVRIAEVGRDTTRARPDDTPRWARGASTDG